jgi:lycopene cyclase domain-containing protein
MRWFYALFNLAIFGGPLVASWLWFRDAWRLRRRMVIAWATVSLAWIVLDGLSVARGWWHYNDRYISGVQVAGLPIEEIAFFFTVPLACMLTFFAITKAVQGKVRMQHARHVLWSIAATVVLFALYAGSQERTLADCLLVLITLAALYRSSLIMQRSFWAWNGAILLLCLIFNTMLTALPVVIYDEQFMTGIRLGTIPIEDLLYNFSLLNLTALVVRPDATAARPSDRPLHTTV